MVRQTGVDIACLMQMLSSDRDRWWKPELNWPTSLKGSIFRVIHGWNMIHYGQQVWFGYFRHLLPVSTEYK